MKGFLKSNLRVKRFCGCSDERYPSSLSTLIPVSSWDTKKFAKADFQGHWSYTAKEGKSGGMFFRKKISLRQV
jgi:hypothetical protein